MESAICEKVIMDVVYKGEIEPGRGHGDFLRIPEDANYVIVQKIVSSKHNFVQAHYQISPKGKENPSVGLGCQTFEDSLQDKVIEELQNLKP